MRLFTQHHMWRRRIQNAVAAALLLVAPTAAQADFSGAYDPANWDISTGLGDGSVDTSSAPDSITVIGANNGVDVITIVNFNTDFTIAAKGTGLWSFDFVWENTDDLVDPFFFDFGGFLLNGDFTEFGGADASSGQLPISVPVVLGDIIGYRVNCTDCVNGRGFLTISNFSAPVGVVSTPEPGTLILVALGAAGLAVARLRRRDN